MKTTLILTAALIGGIALPSLTLAATFPGAEATNCDPAKFAPIYSEDGTTVLYWLNPTCTYAGSGGGSALKSGAPAEDEAVKG